MGVGIPDPRNHRLGAMWIDLTLYVCRSVQLRVCTNKLVFGPGHAQRVQGWQKSGIDDDQGHLLQGGPAADLYLSGEEDQTVLVESCDEEETKKKSRGREQETDDGHDKTVRTSAADRICALCHP